MWGPMVCCCGKKPPVPEMCGYPLMLVVYVYACWKPINSFRYPIGYSCWEGMTKTEGEALVARGWDFGWEAGTPGGGADVEPPSEWEANTEYQVGDWVRDDNFNFYKCTESTAPNQSGNSPPTWDTGMGETTVDNDLKWERAEPWYWTYRWMKAADSQWDECNEDYGWCQPKVFTYEDECTEGFTGWFHAWEECDTEDLEFCEWLALKNFFGDPGFPDDGPEDCDAYITHPCGEGERHCVGYANWGYEGYCEGGEEDDEW